jgi:hypothetical protein
MYINRFGKKLSDVDILGMKAKVQWYQHGLLL